MIISQSRFPRELLLASECPFERQNRKQEKRLSVGDLSMDMKRREAYIGERMMTLTKKEFDLLEYFIQNKDIVLFRDSILNDIWGFDYDGDTRIVDVHVFKLRNKLNASGCTGLTGHPAESVICWRKCMKRNKYGYLGLILACIAVVQYNYHLNEYVLLLLVVGFDCFALGVSDQKT